MMFKIEKYFLGGASPDTLDYGIPRCTITPHGKYKWLFGPSLDKILNEPLLMDSF